MYILRNTYFYIKRKIIYSNKHYIELLKLNYIKDKMKNSITIYY